MICWTVSYMLREYTTVNRNRKKNFSTLMELTFKRWKRDHKKVNKKISLLSILNKIKLDKWWDGIYCLRMGGQEGGDI